MDKQWSELQVTCLDTMGITLWRSKESEAALAEAEVEKLSSQEEKVVLNEVPKQQGVDATEPKNENWQQFQDTVINCSLCNLSQADTKAVWGMGESSANILIITDPVTEQESVQALPLTNESLGLLTKMLQAIDLPIAKLFVTNIIKCESSNERLLDDKDFETCLTILQKQIEFVKPNLILVFGQVTAQQVLKTKNALGDLRQSIHYQNNTIPVVVSYSPASLITSPNLKRDAWEDLKFAKRFMLENDISF